MKTMLCSMPGVVAFLLSFGAHWAHAQQPIVPNISGSNPFANLFRPGPYAIDSYYGSIRPALQMQANLLSLQNQQSKILKEIKKVEASVGSGPGTGRVAGFNTHKKYFGQSGRIASGNRSSGSPKSNSNTNTNSNSANRPNDNRTPNTPFSPFRRY